MADLVGKPPEAAGKKHQDSENDESADAQGEPQTTGPDGRSGARKRHWHSPSRPGLLPHVHHPQVNPENIPWLTLKCGL
jgi:hypothetical protein